MEKYRHADGRPEVEFDKDTGDGRTNGQRADRALKAVATWAGDEMGNDELSTHVADLLTDLMHLCRREGIAFSLSLSNGLDQHKEERVGGFATDGDYFPLNGLN
jgi:hypothetical protein